MSDYSPETSFLFAVPSFWQGVASAIDMGGTLLEYNGSETPVEADARGIASDWAITGQDILIAAKTLGP